MTRGKGYYREEGKPAQEPHAENVNLIPPNVKHWHGAVQGCWFVHLAISTNPQKGGTEWLDPVTEEEYKSSK